MDNDLSNNMPHEQAPAKVPALLKLFFPASARALSEYESMRQGVYELQGELKRAYCGIKSSQAINDLAPVCAHDIIMASKQAASKAAAQREASILKDLQMIDPELTSVDAVRARLMECEQPQVIDEVECDDQVLIPIDGAEAPAMGPAAETEPGIEDEAEAVVETYGEADAYAAQFDALMAEHRAAMDSLRADYEAKIDDMLKRHADERQSLIADYERQIENLHLDIEREQDRANAEKEAAVKAWRAEKAELEARANEHIEELEDKDNALQRYYAAYAEIFGAFMDRVMAVRDAYTGSDPASPVARAISDKIMANDSYGLDDFSYDLRASMEASAADPESLRLKVREAFLECLQTSSANWLNVMARFHAYGRVPFAREALEHAGLDMALLDRAYVSLEDILAYAGIDLCEPRLFAEDFDPECHSSQPIRNIDTYIPDIASHAGPDTIVDLYLVGYDDGTTRRKPAVSKFA